jgi:hypothetical protein
MAASPVNLNRYVKYDAKREFLSTQVERDVKQFLERSELEAAEQPDEANVIAYIVKAVRNCWWGLFLAIVSRMFPPTPGET